MNLPQVIILSTQRSGTHLLLSFLTKHPKIHGMGEMFLKYLRTGVLETNLDGKLNIAILMYSEISVFLKLSEDANDDLDLKIIHLLRGPYHVALSCLQMEADKNILGSDYKAHLHKKDFISGGNKSNPAKRGIIDSSKIDQRAREILSEQNSFIEMLKNTEHLQLNYEDFVPRNESVEHLNKEVQVKLLSFLGLQDEPFDLYTTYVKTAIK